MLPESSAILRKASPAELDAAAILAEQFLVCELIENLIPLDEAERTVGARKAEADEIWQRAVFGALRGLRAAKNKGFHLAHD